VTNYLCTLFDANQNKLCLGFSLKRNAEPLVSVSISGILKLGWGMQRWPVVDLECEPFIRKPPMIPLEMLRLEPVLG